MSQKTFVATSLFLVLSALGAQATAETIKPLDQTISMGSFSMPEKKSTDVGDIGAEFYSYDNAKGTSSTLEQKAEAGINGWIFSNTKRNLISVYARGVASDSNNSLGIGFKVLGADVSFNLSELSAGYGQCAISKSPSAQVWIGPIPVVAEFEGGFCESISVSGGATSSGGNRQFNLTITPEANLSAGAAIGIGFSAASVGVKGSVSLVDVALPISNNLKLDASNQFSISTTGTLDIDFLKGEIGFYAKAGWGPFSVEYNKEFFSWTGRSMNFLVFSDQDPMAKSVDVGFDLGFGVNETFIRGQHVYEGPPEGSSAYEIRVADTPAGGNASMLASGTYASAGVTGILVPLSAAHENKYVQYCFTPKSIAKTGAKVCSGWRPVGPLAILYKGENFGGISKLIPYQQLTKSNQCITTASITPNNFGLSSFKLAYTGKESSVALAMYKGFSCSNTDFRSGSANEISSPGVLGVPSMTTAYGADWNDNVNSFRIVWNENVSAANAALSAQGSSVQVAYDFTDAKGRAEKGTTVAFQRADNVYGDNLVTVQDYSTSKGYKLRPADNDKQIRACIRPSNGYVVGTEVCTDWTAFGKLLNLYEHDNYGGAVDSYPYEAWSSGTCINVEQNDILSSYSISSRTYTQPAGDNNVYGLQLFEHIDCGGASLLKPFPTGATTTSVASIGSAWNDKVTSFKVVYRHVRALEPKVVVNGAFLDPSYVFSHSLGLPESGTKFRWHRASNSQGTGDTIVQNYSTSGRYTLTPQDENKYLRVCISPSDGAMAGPTSCSEWVPMGMMITLYDSNADGNITQTGEYFSGYTVRRSFPYVHISGRCLNLADYGLNNNVRAAVWSDPLFTPQTNDTQTYGATLFDSSDCSNADPVNRKSLVIDGSNETEVRSFSSPEMFRDRASSMRFLFPGYYINPLPQ